VVMAKKPIRFLTIPKLGSMLVTRVDVSSYLNEEAFDEMINLVTKVWKITKVRDRLQAGRKRENNEGGNLPRESH
jgi:hypothetical protein